MNKVTRPGLVILAATASALLVGSAFAANPLEMKQGQGGSVIQGAAGTSGSKGDNGLSHCDKPMGAVAVVEPQDYVMQSLSGYGLQSPTQLIRLLIQQSNCFIVVERGIGMQNMMQERDLSGGGKMRAGSNMGGGQMVSADFILTPAVAFSQNNAGGMAGSLGGLLGGKAAILGAVAGGVKFKEAQTSMLIADARSGIQVAAAEGSSKKADLNLGIFGGGGGGSGFGSAGGYANTAEGKVIAASFLNNYNQIVDVVRGDPSLQRDIGSLKEEAGKKVIAGAVFNEGDVVTPKIGNVKLMSTPADGGKSLATLIKGEELVVIGPEKDGYINVQGGTNSGWVRKVLVIKQ
jgi:curli biogenesis system outer membrane secretion channel CsgG